MKSQNLDKTDLIILAELQKNAQRPIAELADEHASREGLGEAGTRRGSKRLQLYEHGLGKRRALNAAGALAYVALDGIELPECRNDLPGRHQS